VKEYKSKYVDIFNGEVLRIRYDTERKIFLVIIKQKKGVYFATTDKILIKHFKTDLRNAYRAIRSDIFT